MNFNFKQALERLEYSKIIESKAEQFVNQSLDSLKEHILYNGLDIDDGCYFKLGIVDCSNKYSDSYDLVAICYKVGSYELGSMTFEKFGVVESVFEIIEKELNDEGFLCTPSKLPGFCRVIKITIWCHAICGIFSTDSFY